jgi:hypothetical protein
VRAVDVPDIWVDPARFGPLVAEREHPLPLL